MKSWARLQYLYFLGTCTTASPIPSRFPASGTVLIDRVQHRTRWPTHLGKLYFSPITRVYAPSNSCSLHSLPAANAGNLWSRETLDQRRCLFSMHGKTSRYRPSSLVLSRPSTNCMTLQIVTWPEDRRCERSWLLEKIVGANGVIVMPMEKVHSWLVFIILSLVQY